MCDSDLSKPRGNFAGALCARGSLLYWRKKVGFRSARDKTSAAPSFFVTYRHAKYQQIGRQAAPSLGRRLAALVVISDLFSRKPGAGGTARREGEGDGSGRGGVAPARGSRRALARRARLG